MKIEENKQLNTADYWEIDHIVLEPKNDGTTESQEYAYLINRLRGKVKKVKVGHQLNY